MQDGLLYLSHKDVESAGVSMAGVIAELETMYAEKGHGRFEMPPKPGIHTRPDALIHAMPGYLPGMNAAGMKWVSAYPENSKKGLPYISGLIVLNDDDTGMPTCVMDCRWVTAMRTGAKSGLSAKYLARKDACVVGIIGCGIQGRTNLEALSCVMEIERVHAYDIYGEMRDRYVAEMSEKLGLEIVPVETPEAAVREMDVVVTAGPIQRDPKPVIENDWLKPGAFAAPVDFDSYWKGDVLNGVDIFASDDVAQTFYYQSIGYFKSIPARESMSELGDIVAGKVPGRTSDEQRTLALNLGLGLDDVAVAPLVYRAAKKKGQGTWLER